MEYSVFFAILLVQPIPVEARDYHIRASDGEVYTITLGENPGVKNFSVQNSRGRMLLGATETERATAAELYFAAELLSHVLPHYASDTVIKDWEDWEEEVAGVVHRGILKLLTKQGLSMLANGVINGLTGAVQLILGGNKASIVAGWIPGALNNAIGDEIEHRRLVDAAAIAKAYAWGAVENARVLRTYWLAQENPNVTISMDGINAGWVSYHQVYILHSVVSDLLDRYVRDPESEGNIGTGGLGDIAVSLLPAGETLTTVAKVGATAAQAAGTITQLLEAIDTAVYSDEHVLYLQHISENGGSYIYQEALSRIDEGKSQARADLDQASFFQPTKVAQLDDIQILKDDLPQRLDVRDYFSPSDTDNLTYRGRSNDISVAVAEEERSGSSVILITPKDVGTASVTVELSTLRGLSVTQSFTVTVEPNVQQTQRPSSEDTIPPQNLTVPGPARPVDVARYFSSESPLIYEAESSPRGIVTARVSGSQVTITPLREGSVSVFVTAFDKDDRSLFALQTILVTVRSNRATIVLPPSDPNFIPPTTANPVVENLGNRVEIIVQNTLTDGLNIRSNPWVSNINPDNRIGRVYDGATGRITDGPERNGGFIWWKIDWDLENKEGWSVEAFGGSQLLFPHPPDLEVQFNVSDDEVEPGERFTINATVRNNGPGESPATEIFFYYQKSDEDTPRVAGDGKRNVPALRARRSQRISLRVEAPMTPGDYEYGAILPPDIPDSYDEDLVDPNGRIRLNNVDNEDVKVTSLPDLIVESISANKSTVDPGEVFRLEATIRNQGIGEPSRNATLRYYRSRDASISKSDTEVGDDSIRSSDLDTNDTVERSESITAPIEPGVYYYGAYVDLRFESNTQNNASSAVAITVRDTGPSDLVVSAPTLSANTVAPGESFTLETTISNQGTGPAPATTLRGYRSNNANISDVDTEVGAVAIGALAPGTTQTVELRVEVPVAAGTSYYGICVDAVTNESNTVNNCSTAVTLTIENLAPVAAGTPPSQTLVVGDEAEVDVAPYFSDPNEETLTYTVSSNPVGIVAVEMSGLSDAHLRMNPLAAGDNDGDS